MLNKSSRHIDKTYLTKIHDNALMNLLPQVSPEDLNEGDLQCGDLAVHKDSSQVKLYLETHIDLKTGEKNVSNIEASSLLI